MRTVFSNSEVCHVWASQSRPRGHSDHIFFEDNKIYSYGRHYLAAQIYKVKGYQVVLVNSFVYSNSTAKHLRDIRRAVSNLITLDTKTPGDPIASLKAKHAELGERFFDFLSSRANKRNWQPEFKSFAADVANFNRLCELFSQSKLMVNLTDLHRELWAEKSAELNKIYNEKNTPEMIAKREAARIKAEESRQAKAKLALDADIKAWKEGGPRAYQLGQLRPMLLRIKGDQVETSSGASVPLNEALTLLNKIKLGRVSEGQKIGHYAFNRVESGKVVIGCHTIDLSEAMQVLESKTFQLIQGGAK